MRGVDVYVHSVQRAVVNPYETLMAKAVDLGLVNWTSETGFEGFADFVCRIQVEYSAWLLGHPEYGVEWMLLYLTTQPCPQYDGTHRHEPGDADLLAIVNPVEGSHIIFEAAREFYARIDRGEV